MTYEIDMNQSPMEIAETIINTLKKDKFAVTENAEAIIMRHVARLTLEIIPCKSYIETAIFLQDGREFILDDTLHWKAFDDGVAFMDPVNGHALTIITHEKMDLPAMMIDSYRNADGSMWTQLQIGTLAGIADNFLLRDKDVDGVKSLLTYIKAC